MPEKPTIKDPNKKNYFFTSFEGFAIPLTFISALLPLVFILIIKIFPDSTKLFNSEILFVIFISVFASIMLISLVKDRSIFSVLFGESKSFLDIDKDVNNQAEFKNELSSLQNQIEKQKVIERLRKLKNLKVDLDGEFINHKISTNIVSLKDIEIQQKQKRLESVEADKKRLEDSILFRPYFNDIINSLSKEVERSNQKASLLLTSAKYYIFSSIVGYLLIIVISQIYFHHFDFKNQHIIGLVSISFIFIYLQFIGSWYLKQYRYFVDLSSYYLKIKTNWDRYNLIYLTLKEFKAEESVKGYEKLLDLLIKDFSFPDSYFLKKPDLGHTKEAMDAFTKFADVIKTNGKP